MKKYSDEEKAMWLEDWRQSGKKAWTYAGENGLIPQTFCSWVKRAEKNETGFVEIPARKKPGQEQAYGILIEKGDIKIHVPISVWTGGSAVIMEGLKAVI